MPSVALGPDNTLMVSYKNARSETLEFLSVKDGRPESVDDGIRVDGATGDGLPKNVYHFVGNDSALATTTRGPIIAYQDATSHELRAAVRNPEGTWTHHAVAGHEQPFQGGYGFYNAAAHVDGEFWIATTVIDQPAQTCRVELLRVPLR
jgi:hypothetical protein